MTVFKVFPYKQGSRSARALADALGGKVLKVQESKWRPRNTCRNIVINWGCSNPPDWPNTFVLNYQDVDLVSNKLTFFEQTEGSEYVPPYWTSQDEIPDDAFPIVCRTVLNGHSGAGIVIADTPDDLVNAPLYVKYIKKQDEYRVHLALGPDSEDFENILVQKKMRRLDFDDPNWQVRNHTNGFIYAREGFEVPDVVIEAACSVINHFALDFGAVDVIYNAHHNRAYVLEINTAPGLEGQTVQDYAHHFTFHYGE